MRLDPNDRAVPRDITHGVIWRAHRCADSEKTVHLLDDDDLGKLEASSTGHAVQRITAAARERMLLCLDPDAGGKAAETLQETIMAGANQLVRLSADEKPDRAATV